MRFEDLDLSRLGPVPDLVPVDYEAELARLKEGFQARWNDLRTRKPDLPAIDTLALETEVLAILMEEVADQFCHIKAAYNDGVRAALLASAWGIWLEHRAAEFHLTRRMLDPGDLEAGIDPTYESDDSLRERRQMAIEAVSNAGPYGAYAWFAMNAHPDVKYVAVYGAESGLVSPGHVLIYVLDRRGDGTTDGQVLEAVRRTLSPKDRRPLTEVEVTVAAAEVIRYEVSITVTVLPGPDIDLIMQAAERRAKGYAADRHKVYAPVTVGGYESAGTILASDGRSLVEKAAAIITVGGAPRGSIEPLRHQAAYATSVTIVPRILGDDDE